ncbi:MAG: polysaccharide biosynthesis protein [Candidatus Omnitrophica bacterium]|nr:polysaccharide biosynthesis protein [Candidatus Omnitrophota bacterium]
MTTRFKNSICTITGGAGTWGIEITRQILDKGAKEVRIFSRNESLQVAMRVKLNDKRIKFIIGDIRDAKSIKDACVGADYVFHTAALKHVIICERQPIEAVRTNIMGAINVINACIENDVKVCVNISSDKSCHPVCLYGKTKSIAESLFIEANNQTLNTDFISIRSGNIFGSSGSVVPIWIKQIAENNSISITGDNMKRFFITVKDAVKATFKAMELSDRGEVFVPKMDCFYISDLAKVLVQKYGNKDTKINNINPFAYEREMEYLVSPEEVQRTVETKDFYIIYPLIDIITTKYPEITGSQKLRENITMNNSKVSSLAKIRELVKKAGY